MRSLMKESKHGFFYGIEPPQKHLFQNIEGKDSFGVVKVHGELGAQYKLPFLLLPFLSDCWSDNI